MSVFENSIIRWVYKVVQEALKKSEDMIVSTHEVVFQSKRVRYKRLLIIGEMTHILDTFYNKLAKILCNCLTCFI